MKRERKRTEESVIDSPKGDGLCEDVWERVLSDDGATATWQLNDVAEACIEAIVEQLMQLVPLQSGKFTAHITGSITSNTYTKNADIDLHIVSPELLLHYPTPEAANAALHDAYAAICQGNNTVYVGSHPIEVCFQPSLYQDYMSVGCYDVFTKAWEVGPEIAPSEFKPYSAYYKDVEAASEHLTADIRSLILSVYEKAVACKKMLDGKDMAAFSDGFEELAALIHKAAVMLSSIKKMRKTYSAPASKEEALAMRASRKWKIADAAFKLFDKYGYLAILKDFAEIDRVIVDDRRIAPFEEVVSSVLCSVKRWIANPDKLSEKEPVATIDEGIGKALSIGLVSALLAVPGIVTARQVSDTSRRAFSYSEMIDTINGTTGMVGGYTEFQAANIIARTLFAEAREDGIDGLKNVASVVYNRANGNIDDYVRVIKRPSQFSCWRRMTQSDWNPATFSIRVPRAAANGGRDNEMWEEAKAIASDMVVGSFVPVNDANMYYNPDKARPTWGPKLTSTSKVGHHVFGHLVDHSPFM